MFKLKLPYEFVRVAGDLAPSELVKEGFGVELVDATISESECSKHSFYRCQSTEGYTVVVGGSFKIMALNIDGEVDGVYEEISGETVIFQCHPSMVLFIEDAKIYEFAGSLQPTKFDMSSLSAFVSSRYLTEESLDQMNAKFAESSAITLDNFSSVKPALVDGIRVGPADYRSFSVESSFNSLCELMVNQNFIRYLSELTGLPLGLPVRPPYTRILSSAGDYQILHGNYSEPLGLDCILTFYPGQEDGFEWDESVCGRIHYLDDGGTEIFEVPNRCNALTLVYRTEGVVRFLENIKGTDHQPLLQILTTFSVLE